MGSTRAPRVFPLAHGCGEAPQAAREARALPKALGIVQAQRAIAAEIGRSADCPSPLRFDATTPKPEAKAGKSALREIAADRDDLDSY